MLATTFTPQCTTVLISQVGTSDKCQRNNKKLKKTAGSLHPIQVTSKLWCQVGMDLIGPLPETLRGNKYIVTLTDYFSKWAEAAPLPNKSANGVAIFIHSVSITIINPSPKFLFPLTIG